MATLGSLIVNVLANTSGFHSAMKSVVGDLSGLKGLASAATTAIGGVNAAIGAIGAGAAAYHLKSVADEMDRVADTAQRIGMNVEVFKGLEYGAGFAGVSSESLASSLITLNKQIGEAIHGGGKAKVVFEELGISASRLDSLEADEKLRLIADGMSKIESAGERTRIGMRLFGSEGAGMVQFLGEGEGAIKSYMKEAEKLGLTYSQEEVDKVAAFNDAWDKLKKTLGGFSQNFVIDISPAAHEAVKWLQESIEAIKEITVPTANVVGSIGGMAKDTFFRSVPGMFLGGAQGFMFEHLPGMLNHMAPGRPAFAAGELDAVAARRMEAMSQFAGDKAALDKAMTGIDIDQATQRLGGGASYLFDKMLGAGNSATRNGLKMFNDAMDKAKEVGSQWQRSWLFNQLFPKGSALMRDREKQAAEMDRTEKAKDAIERKTQGFNSAIEAGTPEALRAIAASREQNKALDRMLAEQKKANDLARQQVGQLTMLNKGLALETTGLN